MRPLTNIAGLLAALVCVAAAAAEIRVQDIAHLQGQRTNKLMGYGLVVGLPGTGDGEKYAPTMRALMRLHERYHQPILDGSEIKGNNSVALVVVEAEIPEFGAREGQSVDVVVSTVGSAQSLAGGQLLVTPLQYAMFDPQDPATQGVLALAGGRITTADLETPTRGVITGGATLEQDFFYNFIANGTVTLVLDDAHAGWTWAHMVARALTHELTSPVPDEAAAGGLAQPVVSGRMATAIGPKNIEVRIPRYELGNPANFISRVLQAPLFMLPEQTARVTINRTTRNISFTGNVTISPTVLQIPNLGLVLIGRQPDPQEGGAEDVEPVEFTDLLGTLAAIQVTPDQMIDAVEHLHRTGTLHAQLRYE